LRPVLGVLVFLLLTTQQHHFSRHLSHQVRCFYVRVYYEILGSRNKIRESIDIIVIIVTLQHKPSHLLYYTNYLQYRLQSD